MDINTYNELNRRVFKVLGQLHLQNRAVYDAQQCFEIARCKDGIKILSWIMECMEGYRTVNAEQCANMPPYIRGPIEHGRVSISYSTEMFQAKAQACISQVTNGTKVSESSFLNSGKHALSSKRLDAARDHFLAAGSIEHCIECAYQYLERGDFYEAWWLFEYLRIPMDEFRVVPIAIKRIEERDLEEALNILMHVRNEKALIKLISACDKEEQVSIRRRAEVAQFLMHQENGSCLHFNPCEYVLSTERRWHGAFEGYSIDDILLALTPSYYGAPMIRTPGQYEATLDCLLRKYSNSALSEFADRANKRGFTSMAWRALFAVEYSRWEQEQKSVADEWWHEKPPVEFNLLSAHGDRRCSFQRCRECDGC